MANCCSYELHVTGSKESLDKLTEYFKEIDKYDYLQDIQRPMNRIFYSSEPLMTRHRDDLLIVCADCAWSMASTFEIDKEYLIDSEREIYGKFFKFSEICKELKLEAEAWSDECGMQFSEHFFWYEDGNYEEYCLDYKEEYNEESGEWELVEKPDGFYEFSIV